MTPTTPASSPRHRPRPRSTSRHRRRRRLQAGLLALITFLALPLASVPPVGAEPLAPTGLGAQGLVVKLQADHSLAEITGRYPVALDSTLLASRRIYLLRTVDALAEADLTALSALASTIATDPAVSYAEPNWTTALNGDRYHSWPDGQPTVITSGSSLWRTQPALSGLNLTEVHRLSQGLAVKIAVLDTGVDPTHPSLVGRLKGGYDEVDDDADPTDVATGVDSNGNGVLDDAYGHGTFVAGTMALMAPDARILPYRVLDSDGTGNVFVVAQAMLDAADAGAKVINISFGTDQPIDSRTLAETLASVQQRGVIVVAAAGNDASSAKHYPAADPGVLSVTATDAGVLTSWANRGSDWVDVAAPGADLVGPVPGGVYATWSGTSMATPVVAGQIALLRARYPTATATQILRSVTATSAVLGEVSSGSVDLLASLKRKPS